MKDEILGRLRGCPHFDRLKFVYMYGSYVTGGMTERSDMDVCLYYDIKDKRELHRTLFRISGSFPDRYDVKMFQLLPLYVKREVFKGELIYSDDEGFVHDTARRTIKEYDDFEPRYKYILYGKAGIGGAVL